MSKKVWGNITWKLFHTMSLRMKECSPDQIQRAVECIKIICKNLPCPLCSNEATTLLKKYNIKQIQNIEDFKRFIYEFHQKVNLKLKHESIPYDQVESLHPTNLNTILNEFFKIYNQIKHNTNMMLYQFHRDIILSKTRAYFIEHRDLYRFD
jgi:hypothetical protein